MTEAKKFLAALFSDFNGQHFLEIRKLPGGAQTFCRSIDEAVQAANDRSRNVFFGCTLRNGPVGDAEHAALLPALWADVDAKNYAGDKSAAAKGIAGFEFKPSIIIDSGRGFHCYWLLREPEEITPANRAQIEGTMLGIADAIGGDHVHDLPRILRVPDTLNLKDPNNPLPVKIARWRPELRYNLCDFEHYFIAENTQSTPAPAAPVNGRIGDGKRNHTLTSLAGTMRRRGMTEDAIFAALQAENTAKCDPPLPENEVRAIAKSVMRYTPQNPPAHKAEDGEEKVPSDTHSIGPYRVENGAICWIKPILRQGEVVDYDTIKLCNFDARIAEEVERDNGVEASRHFGIEGKLADGPTLPRVDVSAPEFSGMHWPVAKWGARARLSAGMSAKDRLRDAIQSLSIDAGIDTRVVYVHTGWRHTENGWIYLHAGGAIGAQGVEVCLESPLDGYRLPDAPEAVAGAVQTSLGLLDVAPASVTFPMLAVVALSPLCHLLQPDFAVWLFGHTGTMKTTLAALFVSHFGDFPEKKTLSGSWESTGNALEKTLFTLKDTLAIIDDFSPQSDPSAQRKLERAMSQVVRAQGNLSGRSRMRSDTTLRPSYPPRGLMLATGEDVPTTQSILARLLTIEIEQGAVDKARLTIAQGDAHRLPHAMAGFIAWLTPQMDTLADELKKVWRQRRSEASKNAPHLRVPEQVAYLATGFDTYLRYATEINAITREQADRLFADAWDTLMAVAQTHGRRVVAVDPAERFLGVLSGLFASEAVYVDAKDAYRLPDDAKPFGNMIGWADEDFCYLLPDPTRAAVATALRAAGDHWPFSQNALYRALEKRGVLVSSTDRSLSQAKIQGKNRRVLKLCKNAFEDGGNTEVAER